MPRKTVGVEDIPAPPDMRQPVPRHRHSAAPAIVDPCVSDLRAHFGHEGTHECRDVAWRPLRMTLAAAADLALFGRQTEIVGHRADRESLVEGRSGAVRLGLVWRGSFKKKQTHD